MKRSVFRNIAALVVLSLAALAVLQALWLGGMYRDMNEKFYRQVGAAFERAAYDELITRDRSRLMEGRIVTAMFSEDSVLGETMGHLIDSLMSYPANTEKEMSWSSEVEAEVEEDSARIVISIDKSEFNDRQMTLINLNMALDHSTNRESLIRCDSLLAENLRQSGIRAPYSLSLVDTGGTGILHSTGVEVAKPVVFELPANARGGTIFRLAIENPNRGFLREMAGVLLSSVLIILLLGFSFSYLLRTLFRQKSLEKMRLDLTHNITHELKTPIAVASAAGEALSEFGADEDPAKRREYLGVINDQMGRLSGMVETILSMSLYEEEGFRLEFSDCKVIDLVREQVTALSLGQSGKASVTLDIPEELTVKCDCKHLGTAVKNLLDNAVKYSHGRAEITVRAWRREGRTSISVADRGIGIPRAAQGRVFDKFYRVPTGDRHEVKGFGLGLHYVKDTVAGHGGEVTVESTPGRGSRFTIVIP